MGRNNESIKTAYRYLEEGDISGYLEEHPTVISEPVEAGDAVPIGSSTVKMRVDSEAISKIEELFDEEEWTGGVPALAIDSHFVNGRPSNPWEYDSWDVEKDEEGYLLLSDALDRRQGLCAEEALTAKVWMDVKSDLDGYMINGGKIGWKDNGRLEDGQRDPHAYLVIDSGEDYILMDPTMTLKSEERGKFPLVSPVDHFDSDRYNSFVLDRDYGLQGVIEDEGFVYAP